MKRPMRACGGLLGLIRLPKLPWGGSWEQWTEVATAHLLQESKQKASLRARQDCMSYRNPAGPSAQI